MKTTVLLLTILCLQSCANYTGYKFDAITPWGDVTSNEGKITITPLPIILPQK